MVNKKEKKKIYVEFEPPKANDDLMDELSYQSQNMLDDYKNASAKERFRAFAQTAINYGYMQGCNDYGEFIKQNNIAKIKQVAPRT